MERLYSVRHRIYIGFSQIHIGSKLDIAAQTCTHTPTNICLNVLQWVAPQINASVSHQQASCVILAGYVSIFAELVGFIWIGWFHDMSPAFEYSSKISNEKWNYHLYYPFQNQFDVFVLLKHLTVPKFQPSTCQFEVTLKYLDVLLHHYNYSTHFVQCTSTSGRKNSWYTVLGFESLTFIPLNLPLTTVAK